MTTPPRKIGRQRARTVAAGVLATLALVVGLLLPGLRAAGRGNTSVAASLSDSTVDAGEQTQLRITVTNGNADEPPPAPAVDGLSIAYAGKSSSNQFRLDGGSLTQTTTTTYIYVIEANKPGRYTIPGQEISTDSGALRTLPVTLTVLGSGNNGTGGGADNGPAYFELTVPKKSAYVGEAVPIELRAYYAVNTLHNIAGDVIFNGDGFSVQKFTVPRTISPTAPGGRYVVDTYRSAVAGLKIGTVTLGPAEIEPVVQMPRSGGRRRGDGNDPFDSLFGDPYAGFNMAQPRQVKLQTKSAEMEIKPLPEAGKPADFSGAIGQFKLEVEAVPAKAKTGDPVTVKLRLSGQGNFDRIAPPVLSDEHGLQTYPATSKFRADDEVNISGTKTFEQVVIAEGPRTSLPSYRFNYFDPAAGKYVQINTPPMAVKVEGAYIPTPTPAASAAAAPSATATPTPARAAEDILFIRADAGARRGAAAFLPLYQQRYFWATQGCIGVAALVLAIMGLAGTRRRDEVKRQVAALARQKSDLLRVLRRDDVTRREFYTAAARLAQLRAGARDNNLSASEITRAAGLDDAASQTVQHIFDRHEELAYSGAARTETTVPADERREVVAALEAIGRE